MTSKAKYPSAITSTLCAITLGTWAGIPAVAAADDDLLEAGRLEEVIVTARKREESLQDVPVVVNVLTEEEIDRYALDGLESLAANIPELFIGRSSNGSGAQITLRGVGSGRTTMGMEQSTAVVVDGVYYGHGMFLNEAMFDLASIEVLKGPQALFFGKNATAGVISFNTANPTEEFEAQMRAGYETTAEEYSAEGFVSGQISPNLLGRLAVRVSDMRGGYFDQAAVDTPISFLDLATFEPVTRNQAPNDGSLPGTEAYVARGTLVWTPTERFTARFKASINERNDEANAWNFVVFECPGGFTQPNPAVPCEREFNAHVPNAPDGVGGNLPDMKEDGSSYNEYNSWAMTADLSYDFGNATITSVTNYNWHRNKWGLSQNVASPTSYIAATQNTSLSAWSNETRFQTYFDQPVNFMVGFYYQNTDRDHDQAGAFAPLEISTNPPETQFTSYIKPSGSEAETWSGFGQLTWRATDRTELAAGVRYIHETRDSFLVQSYIMPALQGLFLQDVPVYGDQSFTDWTPEVTVTYYPADNLTFFAGYKSAYKSGGFAVSSLIVAATVPSDVTFEPETGDGFEVGMKSMLFDDQLRFNMTLYRFEYEDLQVDFFDSVTFQFITTNAGAAKVEGVEFEADYAPNAVPGLLLSGYLNYNKGRYTDYIAPCYTGQSIAAGCNTNFGAGLGQDLSGEPLAMAPDWVASLNAAYEWGTESGHSWEVGGNLRYSDDFISSSFGAPLSRQDSYFNLDASLRFRHSGGHWEAAVIARNITDDFHISGETDLPNSGSGTGTNDAVPADPVGLVDLPRTVLFQVTYNF
ncbi:TonB-dependent receptor [Elongatibacter sediminis]|uniref:TonB-dependent receptor n=1 Tax=Elongatibacter sediminis TaxID=3119006 RepID=A0AAW9RID4_9GAMM